MSELEDIWKKSTQELLAECRVENAQLEQRISSLERELGASNAALSRAGGEIKLTIRALAMMGATCSNANQAAKIIDDYEAARRRSTT